MDSETPQRREAPLWHRVLKGVGIVSLALVILVVLLVQFENWRGRRAWARYVEELKARGDSPDLAAVVPPPVPDEQNVAMTPLFLPLFQYDYETNRSGRVTASAEMRPYLSRLERIFTRPEGIEYHCEGWVAGRSTDLKELQAAYRADTNFPSRTEATTPGADLLHALSVYDVELGAVREAVARPHSRFPIRYEDSFEAVLPHLVVIKHLARISGLRASAELAEGKVDAAAMDTLLALRLTELVADEPIFSSQFTRVRQISFAMQPVWEGLARRQWSDSHLRQFEAALARSDLLAGFHLAIRGERNWGAFATLEIARREPWFRICGDEPTPLMVLMPDACIGHSKAAIGRWVDQNLRAVDLKRRLVVPEVGKRFDEGFQMNYRAPFLVPGFSMAGLLDHVTRVAGSLVRPQTSVDLARVAIALERHRLKHGAYPANLEALDAAVVPAGGIPHDVISGGPLHYAPTADGQFQLYAVGWNGTDDGGSVVWRDKEQTQVDFSQGDWVWPQPRE